MTQQLRDIDLGSQTDDPVWLSLNINQLNNTPYLIPIRQETPVLKDEKPDTWPLTLIPVDFCRHADLRFWCSEGVMPTQRQPLRDGWLYLFVDGFLWREVKVMNEHYYDINLQRCFGQPETLRPHSGTRLSSLIVPYRYEGDFIDVKAAYSDTQWSWVTIQKLGGMNPQDPRCKNLPLDLANIAADNDYIEKRLTTLDFAKEQPENPIAAAQGTLAKELDATVHLYLKYQSQEESIFALPDLIGEALDIKSTYDQFLHIATNHTTRIQNSDDPDTKLARHLNLRYNIETAAVETALHRGHGLVNAETTGFGRVRTRNREKLRRKHKIRNLQEELDNRKKKWSRIHSGDLKKTLGSKLLQDWVSELYAYRGQICDLFKSQAMVTPFQDYALLGSDEQPFRRVEGLVKIATILDGLRARPLNTLIACVVDIADARVLDQEDEIDTLILGLKEQLTGLSLPGQASLEPIATALAKLTVSGLMTTIRNAPGGNLLIIAKAYYDKLSIDEQKVVEQNKMLTESLENEGYQPLEDRHLNAVKAVIRALSVLTIYQKDQLADYIQNGADLSQDHQNRIAAGRQGKQAELDNQVRGQKKLIGEEQVKIGDVEKELAWKQEELIDIESKLEIQRNQILDTEALLAKEHQTSTDLHNQRQSLHQEITVLRSKQNRLQREIAYQKRQLQSHNQRMRGHQRTLMQINDQIAGGQSPLSRGAHFKSNEQLSRWTSEVILGGLIKEVEVSVDDLVQQRFDANIIPLDIGRLKRRLREDILLIDEIINGAQDTQTEHTHTVGKRKVRLSGQLAAQRAEKVVPLLERVLSNADEIHQQSSHKVKIMAMDLSTQQVNLSQIEQKVSIQDAAIEANQTALANLHRQLEAANDSAIPIKDTIENLEQQKRALQASIATLDSKTTFLIREDMRIHRNLLPVVAGCGFFDLVNFGQKLMAAMKETTWKTMIEFGASCIDIVAFGSELVETLVRQNGKIHGFGVIEYKLVTGAAKVAGVFASLASAILAGFEYFSAMQRGDTGMVIAQLFVISGAITGILMAAGVIASLVGLALIIATVLLAWLIQEFLVDDVEDRYLEEGPFGPNVDRRFVTRGNDNTWWHDDNFYSFKHWQQNRHAAWQEWQSLLHRPLAMIDMDGDDISIVARLNPPENTTLHWQLQMRKNDDHLVWHTLATQNQREPTYIVDTTFAGKAHYGPLKIPAAEWRYGFRLELSEDGRGFQATLTADLLQKIRDRHWGEDTYELRLLVKYVPNANNSLLTEALPAPARKPDGDIADNWQDNQRRAEQYLHRAAANDWWYSLQQTVDTEWF